MAFKIFFVLLLLLCASTAIMSDCAQFVLTRTLDGTCNNLLPGRVRLGAANNLFVDLGGVNQPFPISQNTRALYETLFVPNPEKTTDEINHSDFAVRFAQFVGLDLQSSEAPSPDVNGLQLFNNATSFLDLSTIYGIDTKSSHQRRMNGGKLVLDSVDLMHLIWMQEHNQVADELKTQDPYLDDEHTFQQARHITIAKYQKIIFQEFFPKEFGTFFASKLGSWQSYQPSVVPDTLLAFSHGAFLYGYTSFNSFEAIDSCGKSVLGSEELVSTLRGLLAQRTAPIGLRATEDLSRLLDRAKHLPAYLALRKAYWGNDFLKHSTIYGAIGCPVELEKDLDRVDPLPCFEYITGAGHPNARKLMKVYQKINQIDPIVGLLTEEHVRGTSFGRTIGNIIVKQFERARDGDRFYFERLLKHDFFRKSEAQSIRSTTMALILRRAFPGIIVPDDPFLVPDTYRVSLASSPKCQEA